VGCVVIPDTFEANINVTIRHIEEQADDFWDDVEEDADSSAKKADEDSLSYLRRAIDFMSPIQVVYAAEGGGTSPRLNQIKAKIKQRFGDVRAIKKTGAVGESNRGLLELHVPGKISDAEQKNEIQRIIAAENQDRKALYKEIARLNKDQNMTVATVEGVHAASLMKRAKPGDLVQLPKAGDNFDMFKATAIGKKIGRKAKPGAWVTVP
jgi:uncharacterized protein YdbL (DUF1318 family)